MGDSNISGFMTANETIIKWEHPVSITVDNISSNKSDTITNAVYDIFTRLNNLEKNKEESKVMKVLDIYKKRQLELIKEEYDVSKNDILEKDEFQKIHDDYLEKLKKLYQKEYNKELDYNFTIGTMFQTKETKEAIEKIEEDRFYQETNLEEFLEEVNAMLEMTSDYDKQIEILKTYDILDEEGRINA